jgi:hypothetical protein
MNHGTMYLDLTVLVAQCACRPVVRFATRRATLNHVQEMELSSKGSGYADRIVNIRFG